MFKWLDKAIRNYRWFDISLVKLSTAGFVLMVAKLWPPLLMLDWHWYGLIFVVAAIPPMVRMLK